MNIVKNQELSGIIKLGSCETVFIECWAGIEPPIMDFSCEGASLTMARFTGDVTLQNKTGLEPVIIDFVRGSITIDKSFIGQATVRGMLDKLPILHEEAHIKGMTHIVVGPTRSEIELERLQTMEKRVKALERRWFFKPGSTPNYRSLADTLSEAITGTTIS